MADVILTRGGLVSQAPGAGRQQIISRLTSPTRSSSSSSSSSSSRKRRSSSSAAAAKAAAEQAAAKAAAEKLARQAEEKRAQEAAAQQARQESIRRTFLISQQQNQGQSSAFNQSQSSIQSQTGAQRFQQIIRQKAEQQRQSTIEKAAEKKRVKADRKERFRIGLNEAERKMTTGEVIKGRFREVGVGTAKAGIFLGEGFVNLVQNFGVQELRVDEAGKVIKPERFQFQGEFATRIRNEDLTTGSLLGGGLVLAPLAGASVASTAQSVSQIGVRATASETISSFSPLKIRPGTFGGLTASEASKTNFDVVSQKLVKGDKTYRFVTGRGGEFGDVAIFSRQVSSKGTGFAQTNIISQETRYIGGRFVPQIRTIQAKQFFTSKPGTATKIFSGDVTGRLQLNNVIGSGSRATTTQLSQTIASPGRVDFTYNLLNRPLVQTAAGTSSQKDALTFFAAGKATGAGSILRTQKANIRGIEIDLTNLARGGAGRTIIGSGPSTKQITSSAAQQVSSALSAPKIVTPKLTNPTSTIFSLRISPKTTTIPPSVISQQSKVETMQTPKLTEKPLTTVVPEVAITTLPNQRTSPIAVQRSRQGSSSRSRQDSLPRLDVTPRQIPQQKQKVTPTLTLRERLQQTPRFSPIPFIPPTVPRISESPKVGLGFKLPSFEAPKTPGSFGVQIRRGGQFFSIGNFKTQQQAFERGLEVTQGTLAATFRLTGVGKAPGAPRGFRAKETDLGTLFIERRSKRLNRKSETLEIQFEKSKKFRRKKR